MSFARKRTDSRSHTPSSHVQGALLVTDEVLYCFLTHYFYCFIKVDSTQCSPGINSWSSNVYLAVAEHRHNVTIIYSNDAQLHRSPFPENLSWVKSVVECIKDINQQDAPQLPESQ